MDGTAFAALLAKYQTKVVGFGDIPKIAWGALTDSQYQQLLNKVATAGKQRAADLRRQGWDPSLFTVEDKGAFHIDIFDRLNRQYDRTDL